MPYAGRGRYRLPFRLRPRGRRPPGRSAGQASRWPLAAHLALELVDEPSDQRFVSVIIDLRLRSPARHVQRLLDHLHAQMVARGQARSVQLRGGVAEYPLGFGLRFGNDLLGLALNVVLDALADVARIAV